MLYDILAVIGGLIGLIVTGTAVFTAWRVLDVSKRKDPIDGLSVADSLGRWTVMDYAALLLFAIGALFQFSDLLAVTRDRDNYPYYHYGYLLISFIFMLIGMLFMTARLGLLLRREDKNLHESARLSAFQQEERKPYEADEAK